MRELIVRCWAVTSQIVDHVLGLIAESLDSWRTRQYDIYQRLLNGIA